MEPVLDEVVEKPVRRLQPRFTRGFHEQERARYKEANSYSWKEMEELKKTDESKYEGFLEYWNPEDHPGE